MGMGGAAAWAADGMVVSIDGRTFDPARDDQTVTFGSTEEWDVTNPARSPTRSTSTYGRSP